MLKIKICPCLGRAVDSLLHASSVVRMNSLEYQLQCWLNRSIVLKDVVGFLRPVDFSAENAPAEAASDAQLLRLGQVNFTPAQRLLGPLPTADIHHRPNTIQASCSIFSFFPPTPNTL